MEHTVLIAKTIEAQSLYRAVEEIESAARNAEDSSAVDFSIDKMFNEDNQPKPTPVSIALFAVAAPIAARARWIQSDLIEAVGHDGYDALLREVEALDHDWQMRNAVAGIV